MNNTIPKDWIENHFEYLLSYAQEQIPDRSQAENLVNETFRLALAAQATFSSDSALRKCLTAILKNKISDPKK